MISACVPDKDAGWPRQSSEAECKVLVWVGLLGRG